MKRFRLTTLLLAWGLSLAVSNGPLAASESVDNFRSGKTDSLYGVDDVTPVVHDYRTAPQKDPGFQIPVGPAGANNGYIQAGGAPLGGDSPSTPPINRNNPAQSGFDPSKIPANGPGSDAGQANVIPGETIGPRNATPQSGEGPRSCKSLHQSKYEWQTEIENFLNGRTNQLCGYDAVNASFVRQPIPDHGPVMRYQRPMAPNDFFKPPIHYAPGGYTPAGP